MFSLYFKQSTILIFRKCGERRTLDMSLSVRMVGLMSGQELEAIRVSSKATANIKANVAVQLPTGKRIQNHYPANLTLWELLVQVETASGTPLTKVEDPKTGKYMIPSLTIMNREFATLKLLKESTLYGVGASKAPILFRLRFKPSTLTLAQVLEEEEKQLLAAKEAAEAEAKERAASAPAKEPEKKINEPEAQTSMDVEKKEVKEEEKEEEEKAAAVEKKQDEKMEVEKEVTPVQPESKARKDSEDMNTDKKDISEAEKERIIQEYLKKYQLTDKDLQKFNEENAKAQLQQQQQKKAQEDAKKAAAAATASSLSSSTSGNGEAKGEYDPYGAATDEDVPEEERGVQVFSPNNSDYNPADYDVPDSFYDLTPEDLRALRKDAARDAEEERTLMTREMRERRARARCKVFKRCRIRVRFPDMVELQRVFLPNAKVAAIYRVIRESLADPTTKFSLYTTPPKRDLINQETTLARRGLVPATVVYIKFANPDVVGTKYLRPELEAKIVARKEVPKPQVQAAQKGGHSGCYSLADSHYCALCMTSIGLDKCLECDNYYCRKCWNEVHKDGAMAEHHKTSMTSGPVQSSSSSSTKKKSNMSEEDKKNFVPKWFKLGKQ